MRHSVEELIEIVYSYYPRGLPSDDPRYRETDEYRRLMAARRRAGASNEPWRAMLRRLGDHSPEHSVEDRSLHLQTGKLDACYAGALSLPSNTPGEHYHYLGFMVSFLVPYYAVYSARSVDDIEEIERMRARGAPHAFTFFVHDTMYILPAWVGKLVRLFKPEQIEPRPTEDTPARQVIGFDLSPDEQPFAAWIAEDIKATWGYERMPPEIGNVVVSEVATNLRPLGEARLYDCLFSDDW